MARESLIEKMSDGIIFLDPEGRITDINPAAVSLLLPADFPLGRLAWEAFPWLEPYKDKAEAQAEILLEGASPRYLDLRISPVGEGHGLNGRLILLHDMTECKLTELELERRYQAEKLRVEKLEDLRTRMLEVSAELVQAPLLEKIVRNTMELLEVKIGELALYDADEEELTVAVSQGIGRTMEGHSLAVGEGVMGMVAQTGEPLMVENYRRWANRSHHYEGLPIYAVLGAPLRDQDELLGAIAVAADHESHRFSPADLALLVLLAQHAAQAIRNARLFQQKERLATIDLLTGLPNRKHFIDLAEIEVERAFRYHKPLSAIMLDLDHFKKINETYGHHIGDQVLTKVAQLCQKTLRKVDVYGRYGGEELVVLMPETNRDHAFLAAARLRALVEAAPIATAQGEVRLTVSLGVAELEGSGGSLERLLDALEKALIQAKLNGRNQVQVYPKRTGLLQ